MAVSGDASRDGLATIFFRNGHLLFLAVAVLVVAGISAFNTLPRIEDPRMTLRNGVIVTALPGASASRVEALVTEKIENRLEELGEIKRLDSTSRTGISLVTFELQDDIDDDTNEAALSKIRDKLDDVQRDLPATASKPDLDDKRGAVAFSLIAAVEWEADGPPQLGILNRYAQELADRLRNLPGTEWVQFYGEPREEITVTLDPAEMSALGISAADVASRLAAADVKNPAGQLRTGERDLILEVVGELDSVQRIAAVPVLDDGAGRVVKLADIATVKRDWRQPSDEIALANGKRAVMVGARTEKTVRVDEWAALANTLVAEFDGDVDDGVGLRVVFDQSDYTVQRLAALGNNLLAGALVVMFVVLVGMGWRAALIVGAALPLAASATLFGLTFFDQQIHQMTIFGMIIAIGLLIDNAIVVTDEVRKHLARGEPRAEAVSAAVRHLFVPLFASTLTTVLGFMPVFLLPGNIGDFVGPIAISVVLALMSSFVISMTLIAALAGRYGKPDSHGEFLPWWHDGLMLPKLGVRYRQLLSAVVRRPLRAAAMCLVLPVTGFVLLGTIDTEFFPPADRDQFEIKVWLGDDASIAKTRALVTEINALLEQRGGARQVDWVIGRAFPIVYYNAIMREDNNPSHAHAVVVADSLDEAKRMVPELQMELRDLFPEAAIVVRSFGQGPPIDSPVGFRIFGPNPDRLRAYGDELRRIMHEVPEVVLTQATIAGGEPKLWFEVDQYRAQLAGLDLDQVAGQLQSSLEGQIGGSVLEDLEELPVRIRFGDSQRSSLDAIATLGLTSGRVAPERRWIPASALGDIDLRPELASITRRNGERVNNIRGYIRTGALPIEVNMAVLAALDRANFRLEPGYRFEVAGDSAEQQEAVGKLLTYLPVLLVLMVATLVLSFRSFTLAGIVGAVALLSIGLGFLALKISGYNLGFNPILGTAGLIGVAINGSIVVLAAIRSNPAARSGDHDAIVTETIGATRHIVSTTLTTVAGFLPLMLLTGGDFWPPLAVVIAGGVGFSITLSLVFAPACYCLLQRIRGRAAGQVAPAHALEVGA